MGEDKEHDSVRDVKAVAHSAEQKDGPRRQQSEKVISSDDKDEDDAQQPKLGCGIRTNVEKNGGTQTEQRDGYQTALLQYLPPALRASRI